MKPLLTILLLGCLNACFAGGKAVAVIDNKPAGVVNRLWDLASLSKVPSYEWLPSTGGVRSLSFEGADYQGNPTHVFAYYSNPDVLMGRPCETEYPGVILLHGGGGRAFREWVEKWAAEGYAALAVDLSGNGEDGAKLPDGGPSLSDNRQVFFNAETGAPESMWTYHAVSAAIMAHSLLLSFPEVAQNQTCVTGISWGGYLTCIVASLDNRFRAAAPVYGCGFYDELPFFGKGMMDELSPAGQKRWMGWFDPSVYLPCARIPFLFVNGNTDTAYQLFAYDKSYRLVPDSLRSVCIRPGMKHGHYEGWEPSEIRCFFESVLRGGCPLIRITDVSVDDSVHVSFDTRLFPYAAAFYYSNDVGPDNVGREWKVLPGTLDRANNVFTCPVPQEGFRIGFVTIKDVRLLSASTEFIIRAAGGND